jgi:hypothetical protein
MARRKAREKKSKFFGTTQVLRDINQPAHVVLHDLDAVAGARLVPQDLLLTGILTPSPLNTTENDYNPMGLNTASTLRLDPGGGGVTFSNLGASAAPDFASGTDATSYANAAWTPPTSGLIICTVYSRKSGGGTPTTPTMSGNGITWTQIATVGNSTHRLTMFGANGSGSSNGATTVSFGAETQDFMHANFMSATGVDLTGSVAAAFVQAPSGSGTDISASITLAAAGSSSNRPFAAFSLSTTPGMFARAGWTPADDQAIFTAESQTQYRSDTFETTASDTWDGIGRTWVGIATELKFASAGSTITGIAGGANGRVLLLENIATASITLANDSGSSSAGNRFYCPGGVDYVMDTRSVVVLVYDATDSHWHLVEDAKSAILSFATPAITLGTAAAAGAAGTIIRSDSGIAAFDSTVPVTQASGDAAATGSINFAARRDHKHGMPTLVGSPHGAADHTDITRSFMLVAEAGTPLNGAARTSVGAGLNISRTLAYLDGASNDATWTFQVPSDWASGVITAQCVWTPATTDAVAHTVRWNYTTKKVSAGENVTAAGTAALFTGASAARTVNLMVYDTATSTGVTPSAAGEFIMINVQRLGLDAADTHVGTVRLHGVIISYTANQ